MGAAPGAAIMVRDALLRNAPRHEAGHYLACGLYTNARLARWLTLAGSP